MMHTDYSELCSHTDSKARESMCSISTQSRAEAANMLGGWVNPHREQQTIPRGQTSNPPKSFFTPTAKARPDQAALATSAEARGATHRARPRVLLAASSSPLLRVNPGGSRVCSRSGIARQQQNSTTSCLLRRRRRLQTARRSRPTSAR